ncbi:MAG TPA: NAD(P)H-hydrate dehydratase, partial [Nitrospiria bacterium]|nr:NAD(P)H-hydrate dehydratase [Nitrospiria bacterium]
MTAGEMQELDRRTIEEAGIPADTLMENAGRKVFEAIEENWGPVSGKKVCVVSGKGSNGGDGFVAARFLQRAGAEVAVFLLADPSAVKGDALSNLERFTRLPGSVFPIPTTEDVPKLRANLKSCRLIVDAIFGTGLSSEIRGLPADAIDAMNQSGHPIVSVDLPSGIHSDNGSALGHAVWADLTVALAYPKRGHLTGEGVDHSGRLLIADIGIPAEIGRTLSPGVIFWTMENTRDAARQQSRGGAPSRLPSAHKGMHGHVVVIAGSSGKGGAAVMTGLSALRTGAGLVTLAWPAGLEKTVPNRPFELMTLPLDQTADGSLGMGALDPLVKFSEGKTVAAIGPGLSTHPETVELVRELVTRLGIPVVVDADGLNALAGDLDRINRAPSPLILTPHPGEMARMFETSSRSVQTDRIGTLTRAVKIHPAVWVLKGARTRVAEPDKPITINSTGNPAMATGGTGDVLTGVIAGLLAQGYPPGEAARIGVFL